MLGKPLEYWAVLAAMIVYVASRDGEKEPVKMRIAKTVASSLLAFGASPSLADYFGFTEIVATILIMAFGLIVLDVMTGLARDREFIKELIKSKTGGGR